MSLQQKLEERLKDAMKLRDKRTADALRMVKSKLLLKRSEPGHGEGELSDQETLDVIAAYCKSLRKAIEEYAGYEGDKAAGKRAELIEELAVLEPYLPRMLDEAATRALVAAAVAASGAANIKQVGMVMGAIMKQHKDEVDAALVKQLITEALSAV